MPCKHRAHMPHHPWAVWLALVMALAWSQSSSGNFVEICTATGPRLVAAESAPSSADSPTGQESALSFSHCPF
ncbi:MAG: hypothetical protein Q7K57_43680 [Burkholderiaceae bacterium]|nr:hypothetical protein [Burkholderiaceae bacterium]